MHSLEQRYISWCVLTCSLRSRGTYPPVCLLTCFRSLAPEICILLVLTWAQSITLETRIFLHTDLLSIDMVCRFMPSTFVMTRSQIWSPTSIRGIGASVLAILTHNVSCLPKCGACPASDECSFVAFAHQGSSTLITSAQLSFDTQCISIFMHDLSKQRILLMWHNIVPSLYTICANNTSYSCHAVPQQNFGSKILWCRCMCTQRFALIIRCRWAAWFDSSMIFFILSLSSSSDHEREVCFFWPSLDEALCLPWQFQSTMHHHQITHEEQSHL